MRTPSMKDIKTHAWAIYNFKLKIAALSARFSPSRQAGARSMAMETSNVLDMPSTLVLHR